MRFKVGQTVELINTEGMAALLGATAIVNEVGGSYIKVVWKTRANGQMNGGYYPNQFKPMPGKNEQLLFNFMSTTKGMKE